MVQPYPAFAAALRRIEHAIKSIFDGRLIRCAVILPNLGHALDMRVEYVVIPVPKLRRKIIRVVLQYLLLVRIARARIACGRRKEKAGATPAY